MIGWMLIRKPLSSDSPLARNKEKDSNAVVQTTTDQTTTLLAETKQPTNQPAKKTSNFCGLICWLLAVVYNNSISSSILKRRTINFLFIGLKYNYGSVY